MLRDSDFDPREFAVMILAGFGLRSHDLAVESRDTAGGTPGHIEFDIRDAECDASEPFIGRKASNAISPRTPGLDESFLLDEVETRSLEAFANSPEPPHQRLTIRHHDAGVTAQNLRFVGRQMELAAANVDPHVGSAGHQVGIAGQAETGEIEGGRHLLIGDGYVDVFQCDDIAEVFGGSIKSRLHINLRASPACREMEQPVFEKMETTIFDNKSGTAGEADGCDSVNCYRLRAIVESDFEGKVSQ